MNAQDGKEEEIPEEEFEVPSIKRLMKLNSTEWPYLLVGSIFAAVVGAFPVVFAIILSEILRVSEALMVSVSFNLIMMILIAIHRCYQ